MINIIIKTLIWEVLLGACHNFAINFIILNTSVNHIVQKVVMSQGVIVEELDEDDVVGNECASAEWISKALNWHGVVVDTDESVDVNFCFFNFVFGSLFFVEHSHSEFSIIDVNKSIFLTS